MDTKKYSKMAWLWENMKGYRAIYMVGILGTVVYNIMQLTVPYITQQIIDTFITDEHAAENMKTQTGFFCPESAFRAFLFSYICRSARSICFSIAQDPVPSQMEYPMLIPTA